MIPLPTEVEELKREKNILRLYMINEQDVTTQANQLANIVMDNGEEFRIGDKFTYSNGRIKIGKGINRIRLKGNLNLNINHTGNYALISKEVVKYENLTQGNFRNLSIDCVLEVKENDTVGLSIRSVAETGITVHINKGKGNSFLEIEEL